MTLIVRRTERAGTTAEWNTSVLPLALGELGVEVDDDGVYLGAKFGDGVNLWDDLVYIDAANTGAIIDEADARIAADLLKIDKTTLNANTVLGATADDTPVAIPVSPSHLFGRKATGDLGELTPAEAITILAVYTAAQTDNAISAQLSALVGGAPGLLDTLKEIADALGDDPNFAATMTTALANKQPLNAALTAIAALTTQPYGRSLLTVASAGALATALAGDNAFTTAFVSLGAVDQTVLGIKTYPRRPVTSEQCFFNGIPTNNTTDATAALTAMVSAPGDRATLVIAAGEHVYIGPAAGSTYVLSAFEFDVKPGGTLRIDPTVYAALRIVNPGNRTILDTTVQNLTVTATGGTFILHGGSSTTTAGSSTAAINVSGLNAAGLQTAVRTLTGFSAATVSSLGGGVYQITFASNVLTNLTVDVDSINTATGGTVTLKRGAFAPVNLEEWCPTWWGPTNQSDDSGSWFGMLEGINASAVADTQVVTKAGRRIRAPWGANQFFGVVLAACIVDANPALSFFYPPAWSPSTGVMCDLDFYSEIHGGYWRTNATNQAVVLIRQRGQRTVVDGAALGNRTQGSVGIQCGLPGGSTVSPEVRHIRGNGDTVRRVITLTGLGGTTVFRGGLYNTAASLATSLTNTGATAGTVQTALRTITGFGTVTVTGAAGVFTAVLPSLSNLDIDSTSAPTGGTPTVESLGTMIQVYSSDFKGEDIIGAGFKHFLDSPEGTGGHLHKAHPFACDTGVTGELDGWILDDLYLDGIFGFGVDAPNANGLQIIGVSSLRSGFNLGTNTIRIWRSGVHYCTKNTILGGILNDDYGDVVLIDSADDTKILGLTVRASRPEQQALTPYGDVGIRIAASNGPCNGTEIDATVDNASFNTAAVIDGGTNTSIILGRFRQVLTADLALTASSTGYQNVLGTGPICKAKEKWDVEIRCFADAWSALPDIKNRIAPSVVGTTGPLMMVVGQAKSQVDPTFGSSNPSNAVQCVNGNGGLVAGLGSTRVSTGVDGHTTNGSPTVTGTGLALTGADVGRRFTSNLTGVPTPAYVGVVTNGTTFDMSSSPSSNVPLNATVTQTAATISIHAPGQLMGLVYKGMIDNTAGADCQIPWQAAQATSDPDIVTLRKGSVYEGTRRA